ncbi:O-antigen ligase family protein [Faecalicatena contorta]|uniref:O-antigen ligase family protein n=1 Tax=Faecalicatena contorta TaxID=39482 RepID=UPI001F466416|nr:O-antigen ligase family protein [Faecalicatena contorta]MCF2680724.1 O-antigen ligase family protein [Faecalicatena contorta]
MKVDNFERGIKYGISLYIVLFILYSFVGRIIPVYMFVGESINSYIMIVLALLGAMFVFLDFICKRKMFGGQYCWVLYLFIGVMILSSALNIKYGFFDNVKTIIWTVIQVALFYSAYRHFDEKDLLKFIGIVFKEISIIWTCAVIYSLKQFVIMESYAIEIMTNNWKRQGFRDNRLFGIFNDPNYAAVTSVYVIFMLFFLWRKEDKKCLKVLYAVTCILQGIYIILSGSRTAILAFCCGFFVYLFFSLKNKYIEKAYWTSVGIRALITGLAVVVIVLAGGATKQSLPVLPKMYAEHILSVNESDEGKVVDETQVQIAEGVQSIEKDIFLQRQDLQVESTSNPRLHIWKNYLQGTKGKYILGTSPRNVEEYMEDKYPEIYEKNRRYETHNGYLSVFVGTGIIGLGIVILYMILVGKKVCRYLFCKECINNDFVNLFSILVVILIYTFFFTELFFVSNLTTSVFWLLLGAIMYWIDIEDGND